MADTLVIADQRRALALAGVMGGDDSAVVGNRTRDVLLEAAFFAPLAIAGKARSYGLHTDSSHRFERGVDFDCCSAGRWNARRRCCCSIVGGRPGLSTRWRRGAPAARAPIALRRSRAAACSASPSTTPTVADILQRLGMAADDR